MPLILGTLVVVEHLGVFCVNALVIRNEQVIKLIKEL